jgi:3-methylcrotonyl-CoA carboxylase alpha subunit
MSASDPEVTPLGNGRYLVRDGTRQRLAYGIAAGDARWVFIDGQVYVIDPAPASRRRVRSGGDDALASPMPATVVLVNVEPGQDVAAGDLLVMLEAMKMEVQIRAPRNGRVKVVACQQGDLVEAGRPLVELEPEPNLNLNTNREARTQQRER